jgi:catechol 2,3-dioxygenase-like lactoylglutathione lyase family enzyme
MDNVHFDHCVIHVSDWDRSNLFYRDAIGAEIVDHPDGLWAYRFGGQQLNVYAWRGCWNAGRALPGESREQ